MHALAGTWKANLEKSRRDPNHQFYGATIRLAIDGEDVTLTFGGVNAAGKTEEGIRTMRADGLDHPESAAPGVMTASTLDARTLKAIAKKDGAVIGSGTYEVSGDGQTWPGTSGVNRRFVRRIAIVTVDLLCAPLNMPLSRASL